MAANRKILNNVIYNENKNSKIENCCYPVLAVIVCQFVRPSEVGVLLRWLNLGSRKQRHTIAEGLYFLMPKISAKFQLGHPKRGRQIEVG